MTAEHSRSALPRSMAMTSGRDIGTMNRVVDSSSTALTTTERYVTAYRTSKCHLANRRFLFRRTPKTAISVFTLSHCFRNEILSKEVHTCKNRRWAKMFANAWEASKRHQTPLFVTSGILLTNIMAVVPHRKGVAVVYWFDMEIRLLLIRRNLAACLRTRLHACARLHRNACLSSKICS